jgi:hypothetical protein
MPKLNDNDILYFMLLLKILNIMNIESLILYNIWLFQQYLFLFNNLYYEI